MCSSDLRSVVTSCQIYDWQETMITITEFAAGKVKDLMGDENPNARLRVYVKGGGCSGFSYGMVFDEKITEDDTILEYNGVKLTVDSQSAPLLQGAEIDYTDGLQGSGFQVKNPNAKSTCGCGSSFSA